MYKYYVAAWLAKSVDKITCVGTVYDQCNLVCRFLGIDYRLSGKTGVVKITVGYIMIAMHRELDNRVHNINIG